MSCGSLWAQTFGLDPFGNLKSEGSVNWQPNYDGNNHASNTAYDADGNTLNDGFHAYAWDAAGEMATVDSSQAVYDALGRRVEGAGAEWLYAPSGGNRLALMGGQSLNFAVVPLPSGFAVYNSAGLALYQHADWLGSSRVDSTPARTATSLTAYAPYGDPDNGMSDLGFTGKGMNLVNGATAGLYDFPFREYQPTAGRWLSPDPAGLAAVSPANPQSWNRYAYVANQPLSAIDPLGLSPPADATVYLSYMNFDEWIQETQFDMGGGWGAPVVPHSDAKPDHPYSPGTGSFSGIATNPQSTGFTLSIRQPGQTFGACMAANANTYSLGGSFELAFDVATGKNTNVSHYLSAVVGNSINSFFFGSTAEAAGDMAAATPSLASSSMGSVTTYGRRTSDILSLNLEGAGGLPAALSPASARVKSVLGAIGDILNLDLSFTERFSIDAAFTGAEAIDCAIPR